MYFCIFLVSSKYIKGWSIDSVFLNWVTYNTLGITSEYCFFFTKTVIVYKTSYCRLERASFFCRILDTTYTELQRASEYRGDAFFRLYLWYLPLWISGYNSPEVSASSWYREVVCIKLRTWWESGLNEQSKCCVRPTFPILVHFGANLWVHSCSKFKLIAGFQPTNVINWWDTRALN